MALNRILGTRKCEFCNHKSHEQKDEVKYLAVFPASNPMYVTPACEEARNIPTGDYLLVPMDSVKLELYLSRFSPELEEMREVARFLADYYTRSLRTTR